VTRLQSNKITRSQFWQITLRVATLAAGKPMAQRVIK